MHIMQKIGTKLKDPGSSNFVWAKWIHGTPAPGCVKFNRVLVAQVARLRGIYWRGGEVQVWDLFVQFSTSRKIPPKHPF